MTPPHFLSANIPGGVAADRERGAGPPFPVSGGSAGMRVAGIGCREGAPLAALEEALDALPGRIDAVAVLSPRWAEVMPLCDARGMNLTTIPAGRIRGVVTPTQSARIQELYGTGSVCEAVALLAAGAKARILRPRVVSADGSVTVALAEGKGW